MASKVIKDSFKTTFVRNYAAQVAASKQHGYSLPHHQPNVSKLSNGAVVAAYENNSPLSRIAIFVKCGSRYETPENLGTSHLLRLAAGLKTDNFSAFGLTRMTQQLGGTLVCESGREHISYEITALRDDLHQVFKMLSDVAVHPKFRPWELRGVIPRLMIDLSSQSPIVKVLELLHKAAFRGTGLGNSLFMPGHVADVVNEDEFAKHLEMPDHRAGKINAEQVQQFFNETHTGSRMAFVGLGVDHKELAKLAKDVTLGTEAGPSSPSTYFGGEVRQEIKGHLAYVALAGPGAKLGTDEAVALGIAQFILGGQAGTKYGSNSSGKLAELVAGAGGTGTVNAINASYTDAGLFGFTVVEEAQKVGDVVKAVAKGIRTLKITDVDVKSAKLRAKSAILMATESGDGELDEMGLQALFTGGYIPPSELIASIDRVTAASVQSALTNATKGKPSMAAVGAIHNVPYLDQI